MLDSCCISIGLVFIKDRPVSSFWVLRFRSRVLRFRVLGASFSTFRGLRFRVLGASFSKLPFKFPQINSLSTFGITGVRFINNVNLKELCDGWLVRIFLFLTLVMHPYSL